jgi:hypothetical protein
MLGVSAFVVIGGDPLIAGWNVIGDIDRLPVQFDDFVEHGDSAGLSWSGLVLDDRRHIISANDPAFDALGFVGNPDHPSADVESVFLVYAESARSGEVPDQWDKI